MRTTRHRRRCRAVGGAMVPVALLIASCGGQGAEKAASPLVKNVTLVKSGKFVVCTNVPYEPFSFTRNGKVVGFDIALMDKVSQRLGVKQEIVDIDFDPIRSGAALNSGRCDVAAAGITITQERRKNVAFSDSYFDEALSLMSPAGKPVATLDEARAGKLRVGVLTGTTSMKAAVDEGIEPQEYKDSGKQLTALRSGSVDVIVQDLPVVTSWLKKPELAGKFTAGQPISTGAHYGFVVKKKGSEDLLKVINDVIADAKQDGSYARLHQKWLGVAPEHSTTS
ncbi:polar amino acid transport system substrate-binding protein [Streptomyces africanus]|uniref:Polar amino acid transport system substrate-binding protein n=1 Tax=Streptomyces africanus TaxID=231024 RepID=A0ABU0QZI5_9ACTN|nr:ABC transporter substrate-binding protein [Streptomyces africanus]MDQ0752812.1 polar amino acid transport system substrate-binding protein [Streptomyces africanus]